MRELFWIMVFLWLGLMIVSFSCGVFTNAADDVEKAFYSNEGVN